MHKYVEQQIKVSLFLSSQERKKETRKKERKRRERKKEKKNERKKEKEIKTVASVVVSH